MTKNIDQRLAALYYEYVEKGEETKFIDMLLFLIERSPVTARRNEENQKTKDAEKAERNYKRKVAQERKDEMTIDERIKFLNTPFVEVPDDLRDDRLVEHPQEFNFIRFADPDAGLQKETFGARLIRYMYAHGFTTTDEETGKEKLDVERFSQVCKEFAKQFDTPARRGHRPQKTRVTATDLNNYVNWNICPKIDKMTVISEAMNVDIEYLGGYRGSNPPKNGFYNAPFGSGPLGTKFRKKRTSYNSNDVA